MSSDILKIAMPPEAVFEAGGAGDTVAGQSLAAIIPLLDQPIPN